MASGCRVGQCESCAVRLLEGSVAYAEPPGDLEGDLCLTCSATPASDILLDACHLAWGQTGGGGPPTADCRLVPLPDLFLAASWPTRTFSKYATEQGTGAH